MDIVARAKGLLLDPRKEWGLIAGEPADLVGLIKDYVLKLSGAAAVASFIGALMMSLGRVGFGSLLVSSILGFLLGLVGIFVLSKIIEILAPKFGAPEDPAAAVRLAVYAPTASWVGGLFMIIPWIGWIPALVGAVYSLYLFYIGTPIVTRVPPERVLTFALSVFGVAILVNIVIGIIVSIFA